MTNKYVELHDQVFDALHSVQESIEDLRAIISSVSYLFPNMAKDLHDVTVQLKTAHDQLRNAHIDGVDERVQYNDLINRNLLELAMRPHLAARGLE